MNDTDGKVDDTLGGPQSRPYQAVRAPCSTKSDNRGVPTCAMATVEAAREKDEHAWD